MPKGEVWVTSMVPWVSTMFERVLNEMDDRCWPLFFVVQGVLWGVH